MLLTSSSAAAPLHVQAESTKADNQGSRIVSSWTSLVTLAAGCREGGGASAFVARLDREKRSVESLGGRSEGFVGVQKTPRFTVTAVCGRRQSCAKDW